MADNSLHKLEVSYNQLHDRLILIIHTQNLQEYLFWLTRRAVPLLWKLLTQLIKSDNKTEKQHVQEKQHWEQAIKKEQAQKHVTAEQLSTRVSTRPLGNEPLLLNQLQGSLGPNGTFKLRLEDINGKWIECAGQTTVLIALCQLIKQTAEKAEWNLDLEIPE